jgi:2-C-methyl-D-erythritol 4-phosphate cytidylyltransferase
LNGGAILPAAGLGTRTGKGSAEKAGTSRKQFMLLDGSPILIHTVRKFAASDRVTEMSGVQCSRGKNPLVR